MPSRSRSISARPFVHPSAKAPLHCDAVSLESLARQYGTPLYVYSANHMLQRLGLFQEAFSAVPHLVCYAVKANSALGILRVFAQHGTGFDVVSGGELE